jgi:hypothetical protein
MELCSFKGIYDIISPFPMSTKVAAGKWGRSANDSTAVLVNDSASDPTNNEY